MAEAPKTISEPLSLDQQFEKDNAVIAELLKAQGVEDADPFSINTPVEQVPEAEQTTKDLDLAENEPASDPEKKEDPPVVDPPAEKPTPEVPPVVDPPVETPPVETAPVEQKRKPIPWAEKRAAERKLADTQRELAELKKREADREAADAAARVVAPEDDFEDPLEAVKKKQEVIEGELKRQADENRQRDIQTAIVRDESSFKQQNPDYDDALKHVVKRARERFEVTGVLQEKADMILANYADQLDGVMRAKGIADPTVEDAENTARDMAFALVFEQERQQFVGRQLARGRSVAQAAYDLAILEGYVKPAAAAPATPAVETPAVAPAKTETAQEKVARAAKIDKANASLSAMQTAGKAKTLEVRTQAEFNSLSPKDQDKFVAQMEEINPNWLQDMPVG